MTDMNEMGLTITGITDARMLRCLNCGGTSCRKDWLPAFQLPNVMVTNILTCPHCGSIAQVDGACRKESQIELEFRVKGVKEHAALCAFLAEMKLRLCRNRHKSGWEGSETGWLLGELESHTRKLRASSCSRVAIDECADIANFAMMIADNTRRDGVPCGECPECKQTPLNPRSVD